MLILKKYALLAFAIFGLLIVYSIAFTSPLIMIDEDVIITPLKHIHSLQDYINLHKFGKVLDIQPIRDLSHYIDLRIVSSSGWQYFPLLHNIVLQILCSLLLFKIFRMLFTKKIAVLISLLFLFHPAIVTIFLEPTSRKHILSFLFFLVTYYIYLQSNFSSWQSKLLSTFTYLLTIFSQPINITIPIWIFFTGVNKQNFFSRIKNFSHLFAIGLIGGILNIYYYTRIYPQITGFYKIFKSFDFSLYFHIFGRYISQIFIPISYKLFYSEVDFLTTVGTFVGAILLFLSLKFLKISQFFYSWSLFFFIFFTLYHKPVDIFFLNTYLLTPFLAICLIISFFLSQFMIQIRYIYFIMLFFILISLNIVSQRSSKLLMFETAYKNDSNCRNLSSLTYHVLHIDDRRRFQRYGDIWLNTPCRISSKTDAYNNVYLITNLIYLNQELSDEKKIQLFEKRLVNTYDLNILKAALASQKQKKNEVDLFLRGIDETSEQSIFLQSFPGIDLAKYCADNLEAIKSCKNFLNYYYTTKNKVDIQFRVKN